MPPLGLDGEHSGLVRNISEMSVVLLLDHLEVRLVVLVLGLHLYALEVQAGGYSALVLARVWHEPPKERKFYMKRVITNMLLVRGWKKCELFSFLKRTFSCPT